MSFADCSITKLQPGNNLPFDLLLSADETIEAIEKYIYNSDVYVVKSKDYSRPIAVFALYRVTDTQIEIKNIAVLESLQGRGIGSYLLREIRRIAEAEKYKNIIVGTPDCAFRLLHFYERNGFTRCNVRKDFFVKNYSKPIIEAGVMLRDMAMLELAL